MNISKTILTERIKGRGNRVLAVCLFLFTMLSSGTNVYATGLLPGVKDLASDGRLSEKEAKPILVFFSSSSCPYCEIVRDLYLQPMMEDRISANKVIIREVSVDGIQNMRDFSGKLMEQQSFADREGASFTPVVRLYSSRGELLTPDLVGYSSPDFYLGYLEGSIESARKKILQKVTVDRPAI